MANELNVNPLSLDIAVGTENFITISGESESVLEERSGYDLDWFVWNANAYLLNPALVNFTKLNDDINEIITSSFEIPKEQPFAITAQSAAWEAFVFNTQFGLRSNTGKLFVMNHGRNGSARAWSADFDGNTVIAPAAADQLETFRIVSDGVNMMYYRQSGLMYQAPIPASVQWFKLHFLLNQSGIHFHNVNIYTAAIRELVNAATVNKTFVPSGNIETRVDALDTLYIKPLTAGSRNLIISHPTAPLTQSVLINATSLYIRPKVAGTYYVQEQEIVEFESNAVGGIFTASGGVIVDSTNLKWQAIEQGAVTITYEINGYTATFALEVIPKIELSGVEDGLYQIPLAQGESIQFNPNIEGQFSCINYPNVITASGFLVAPTDARDSHFGKKDLEIRFSAYGINYDFIVEILPMFPTPAYGGILPAKWLQLRPDFLPVSRKTVGGAKEARNENSNGVITWNISYNTLKSKACACGEETRDCQHRFDASRLDAFYRLVTTTDYFSVVDYHTNELFKFVTIEEYGNDHDLFATGQTREIVLYFDGGDIQL